MNENNNKWQRKNTITYLVILIYQREVGINLSSFVLKTVAVPVEASGCFSKAQVTYTTVVAPHPHR